MSGQRIDLRSTLQSTVDDFTAAIGYPRRLAVSAPYYPYDDPNGTQQDPNFGQPGCYVYAGTDGKVHYVGKAARYLGNRIWAHIGRRRRQGETGELYPNAETWIIENQPDIAVWAIPVPDEHWWLAGALEGFLTEKFLPDKSRQI